VLTAKAVQKVLLHLSDADSYSARWLNNYCNEHAPLEGNDVSGGCRSRTRQHQHQQRPQH
jgi:hypothetical protein